MRCKASLARPTQFNSAIPAKFIRRSVMRLRANEVCPIHKSFSCWGRERIAKPRLIRLGVQRVEDPHHPRGYRELRSPAEMRKLLNRKTRDRAGCARPAH